MRKIDYKEGRELEKTHVCKECGGGLVTCWQPGTSIGTTFDDRLGYHITRCAENKAHEGEVRKDYLQYHLQPQEIKDTIDRKERKKQRESY